MPAIFDDLDSLLPDLEYLYKDLHAHPELAFQEKRTASVVAGRLTGQGWEVTTGVGGTGVVGVLRNGDGPVVMLRADMDALPVREETGLPYASRVTALDDQGVRVPVMHACGHDVHVTCLLGACALFAARREEWRGTVVAVFQPAEESGLGARAMVADGLFERFPKPEVVLGQHVGPGPAGLLAKVPGLAMGATDNLSVRLFGRGGHGSKPESAVDPVLMAANLVTRLQTIVSRETAAQDSVVVTVGSLHAGTAAAVIPAEAELGINVRTFSPAAREKVMAAIERFAKAESLAAGAPREPEIVSRCELPATVNEPAATERVAAAHGALFGPGTVVELGPNTASEDFGVLGTEAGVPSVLWFFGGNDPKEFEAAFLADRLAEDIPQNHSPQYAPVVQPTLSVGVRAMTAAALAYLAPREPGVRA
ncbi:amidohydrolase [Streptomyces eurocidicus]|uniref:Amidohydrolase n=1 Tax=Streptomyces eurocidicus TaxID=66423 RepID=A0A2N8NNA3_STREU|nr:amidohydrolase [Streptomyces eurocidicus]MBB5118090.1 hippurate hydrolase [Streptomyces eurocidicus]MBF6054900.1 amidohydrolase [Streptomyces eurocidicus]PNE30245.1 amidohydrolase [Streptomyces eurocidicus]